ncbi:MAG: hypothetical protein H0W74_12400 [Sphingosinicella sp.]|nr:hypothetical protein [Sphingosinicella sp.]
MRKISMATAALAALSVPALSAPALAQQPQAPQQAASRPIQPVDLPASAAASVNVPAADRSADEEYSPLDNQAENARTESEDANEEGLRDTRRPRMDPRDEAIVRSMPDRREIEDMTGVAARAADAILDTPVGPLREAIEGRKLSRRERQETLGDRASKDDPYFRERMRDQIGVASVAVGALAEQMAVMAPVLRRTLEDVERRVEDAARGVPPREYDRRDDPNRD